jgi:2-polyprenyl-3-methyl-5-hydroxy-6-metoxy-1,4-benzoquinol methylase
VTQSGETRRESLAATGERLVPDQHHGELVHAEHLARYQLAAQLASGRRVLDAASGEGYGSAILAAAGAESVTGIDLDPSAVAHARARYGLKFEVADVAALPHADASFDLVVSFETIEHVSDPVAVLSELRRVLASDGTLIISTPNAHQSLVENEFHIREFTHDEFVAMLTDVFPTVEMFLQHSWLASMVSGEPVASDSAGEHRHQVDLYGLAGVRPGRELYAVAVCGTAPHLPTRPVAVLAAVEEAHRVAIRLKDAEETGAHWHQKYLDEHETAVRWHDEYRKLEGLVEEQRVAYESELETVYRSASWRLTEPLRRAAGALRGRRG